MNTEPSLPASFLSVDWGTSRLRVRLVQVEPFSVLADVADNCGIAATFSDWKAAGEPDREPFYAARLNEAIGELATHARRDLSGLPVIVSGMASSTIGMRELPYGRLPAPADARCLKYEGLPTTESLPYPAILISGLATDADVMRGEETQLVGLLATRSQHVRDGLYILPGTHSKHVEVRDGQIQTFRTYVTGELYGIISKHSVLADCVDTEGDSVNRSAFEYGVQAATDSPLLNELFAIRARAVLGERPIKRSNADYLSGLLIGCELRKLAEKSADAPVLAATDPLRSRYVAAFDSLGLGRRAIVLDESTVAEAVVRGQLQVLLANS